MARMILLVIYMEYELQGAVFMFESHETYQCYFLRLSRKGDLLRATEFFCPPKKGMEISF